MRRIVVAAGLVASWSVWLLGNAIWVESSAGTATGSALFSWLWVPALVYAILLLLRPIAPGSIRIVGALSTAGMLALATYLLTYPWQRSEYLVLQAEAHSGIQTSSIPDATAQPAAYAAVLALTIVAISALLSSWSPPAQRKRDFKASNMGDTATDDPRTLWDSLSD